MKHIKTPIDEATAKGLRVGDRVLLSGELYCGRDAVLPKIVAMLEAGEEIPGVDLRGGAVFHTAVSPAGMGPTSSNKKEIEGSFPALSKAGVKLHLGKGAIHGPAIRALEENNAVYAVMPPVTALLRERTLGQACVAFPEEGMEAFYRLQVKDYPAIIAAAHGISLFDREDKR